MCLRPIIIKVNSFDPDAPGNLFKVVRPVRCVQVPCGKCVECLSRRHSDWMIRLYEEFKFRKIGIFFTLTYRDSSLPFLSRPTVCGDDVKRAFKQFRNYFSKRSHKPYSYFLTSEYGPRTLRPHYHGLVFGLTEDDFRLFLSNWSKKYGFVDYDVIYFDGSEHSGKVARYVSKYCSKGMFENPFVKDGDCLPTFHLVSKGLGSHYLSPEKLDWHRAVGFPESDRASVIAQRYFYYLNGYPYPLPRYYCDKIVPPQTRLAFEVNEVLFRIGCDFRDRKFDSVSASYSSSGREAYRDLAVSENIEIGDREAAKIAQFKKFYNSSKL